MEHEVIFGNALIEAGKKLEDAPDIELVKSYVLKIHQDIENIKTGYIRLGFHLAEIKRCQYYRKVGYFDFYLFCERNYNLSKSEVSRCINVWNRFCLKNPDNTRTMFVNPKYEQYSYSQLIEMLPLDDKDIKDVRPEMTVKELREYKKNKRNSDSHEAKTDSLITVEIDTKSNDIVSFDRKSCDVATKEKDLDLYNLSDVEALSEEFFEHLEKCKLSGNEQILKRNTIILEALYLLIDDEKKY